jgi:uncharacterized membrane protein
MNEEKQAAAERLGAELRTSTDPAIARRRGIVGLSLAAAGAMGYIALYQMGIIKHLKEPPLPRLDADTVDASAEAYAKLSTPDAVLGLGSYAATMTLAAMGGRDRAAAQPWIPLALTAKVAFDTLQAGRMTYQQWTQQRAFCFWCLLAAASTAATVPLVIPELRAAVRQLTKGHP